MNEYVTVHDICQRLKDRRRQLGMSQIDLALASGTNNKLICRYERGHGLPKLQAAIDLANAMGLDIDLSGDR